MFFWLTASSFVRPPPVDQPINLWHCWMSFWRSRCFQWLLPGGGGFKYIRYVGYIYIYTYIYVVYICIYIYIYMWCIYMPCFVDQTPWPVMLSPGSCVTLPLAYDASTVQRLSHTESKKQNGRSADCFSPSNISCVHTYCPVSSLRRFSGHFRWNYLTLTIRK